MFLMQFVVSTFTGIELEMVNLYGIVSHQKAGLFPMQLTIYKGV